MTRRLTSLLLLAALVLAGTGALSAAGPEIEVGQLFPDLALRTLDGDVRRVSDYRGTKLVLHVFASW